MVKSTNLANNAKIWRKIAREQTRPQAVENAKANADFLSKKAAEIGSRVNTNK